jgi:F-type H+-transporting ATPase subunit epsilon
MSIHVDVVSAENEIYSGSADRVFAPGVMGEMGILPQHAPLLTRLKPGELRVQAEGEQEHNIFVFGGLLEIQPHLITVLADTAERTEDIDEAEAEKARQRAEQEISDAGGDEDALARAQTRLAVAEARLELLQRFRTGGRGL